MSDVLDKVDALIAGNPEHLVAAAITFEELLKDQQHPDWSGRFRVYGRLKAAINERYPLVRPPMTNWPTGENGQDLMDESDPRLIEWLENDPLNRWDNAWQEVRKAAGGSVLAHMYVWELQQSGKDLI